MATKRAKMIIGYIGLNVLFAAAAGCLATAEEDASSSAAAARRATITDDRPVPLDAPARKAVVEKKVTCPFVGAAAYLGKLQIRNAIGNPLARIEEIVALGNEGGGNLGSIVLKTFALGNHARMYGHQVVPETGKVTYTDRPEEEVPDGMFSLDFPASRGSHPGHSGILQRGFKDNYAGALDPAALQRLLDRAVDGEGRLRGTPGFTGPVYIKRSDLGEFVWENVSADPESTYVGHGFSAKLLFDLKELFEHPTVESIVQLSGTNDLVGSSGEFGLLMTLLERPERLQGEPVIFAADVQMMFERKELPADWAARPKTASAWVEHTTKILVAAEQARLR